MLCTSMSATQSPEPSLKGHVVVVPEMLSWPSCTTLQTPMPRCKHMLTPPPEWLRLQAPARTGYPAML